jgi:hypothetical protein
MFEDRRHFLLLSRLAARSKDMSGAGRCLSFAGQRPGFPDD